MTVAFREFRDSSYTQLRKSLLKNKGSERQRAFLRKVRSGVEFLDEFDAVPAIGTVEAKLAPDPMTENEFKDPPADTEQTLYNAWGELTPAIACRSTFWAKTTVEHIRSGRIQSVYLAANGGNLPGGAERIDFVLQDRTGQAPQRVDSCVRTVLRRLGGLPEVRGNRSVYVDCPLARAWWRERTVQQAANADAALAKKVRGVVRIHQTYWEKLIDRIVFRNSTFGSPSIRNAFIRALAQFVQTNPESELANTEGLQRLCRRTTAYQGSRELSILSNVELDVLMSSIVEAA